MNKVAYVGAPLDLELPWVKEINVLKIVYNDLSHLGRIEDVLALTSKRGAISLHMAHVLINSPRVYCIGEKTAAHVIDFFGKECIVPDPQNTEGLASLLISREKKVHLITSDSISQEFMERLKGSGIEVFLTVAYRIDENANVDFSGLEDVKKILVGSSKSFEILFRCAENYLKGKEVYAIGIPTQNSMLAKNFKPSGYFDTPDIEGALKVLFSQG